MQGLLAKLNQQKNSNLGSKSASRSASIASHSSDEEQQSNSDESQSQQTSNTFKPKVRREKKSDDKVKGWNSTGKEVKAKAPKSRIDTGITNVVKLKLLDATRKAIIDKSKKQIVSSYTQTDRDTFKTKLCKDQSTETETEMTTVKSKDGTLIVTTTCAVNTDKITTDSISTQTVMPRSNVSFKKFMDSRHSIQYAENEEDMDMDEILDPDDATMELKNIEKRLTGGRKLSRQVSSQRYSEYDKPADAVIIEPKPRKAPKVNRTEESDSEFEDSIQDDLQPDVIKESVKRSKPSDTTFNSWHDLKFPEEKVELPRNYFSDGPTPWANFQDLVLGQRFLNARLSPAHQRQFRSNTKQVSWSDSQAKIVGDLIREANALLDMFDHVAMLLGPDIKLHKVSDVEEFTMPPSKYSQEMANSCDKLEESLKRLQNFKTEA